MTKFMSRKPEGGDAFTSLLNDLRNTGVDVEKTPIRASFDSQGNVAKLEVEAELTTAQKQAILEKYASLKEVA